VADDAADGCTANGSNCAAARQNRTANRTNTRANGSTLVLRRHAGTPAQAEQQGCGKRTKCESKHCFHGITPFLTIVFPVIRTGSGSVYLPKPGCTASTDRRASISLRHERSAFKQHVTFGSDS
jgi:hypothetical protein